MTGRLEAIRADITTLEIDAIVNAANEQLHPGGGVDGAIRRAAGPELNKHLAKIGHCAPGTAVITPGYALPARFAIHTVGPIWRNGGDEAAMDETLANCYRSCLRLAEENDVSTIAFPSISTGIYGFPFDRAADIAIATCRDHLKSGGNVSKIIFCCFSESDRDAYQHRLDALAD
jgi:O-acetyl-ADP-ribose deacetylase (regulator of RNase III)